MNSSARHAGAGESGLISVVLNGEPRSIEPISLAALIETLGHPPQTLATAVNGEFVARDARAGCRLRDGDRITTFQRIVGG